MNSYEVMKILYPITTTAKKGVNVQELVKTKFPKQYKELLLYTFKWDDLDGVLDFLYGEREIGFLNVPKSEIDKIIALIENGCEVKQ